MELRTFEKVLRCFLQHCDFVQQVLRCFFLKTFQRCSSCRVVLDSPLSPSFRIVHVWCETSVCTKHVWSDSILAGLAELAGSAARRGFQACFSSAAGRGKRPCWQSWLGSESHNTEPVLPLCSRPSSARHAGVQGVQSWQS